MTQAPTLTDDNIIAALGNSSRFPAGSPQFEIFAPFIGHLAEIVGKDHLNDKVGVGNLCGAVARFITWLADNPEFSEQLEPLEAMLALPLYHQLAGMLQPMADDPQGALRELGITEAQAMEMESLGLNDAAIELYRAGELTFARLLVTAPDVFIPKS